MWKLVIEDDEGKRTVVPLTRDDYSIGRQEGNTIRLTERNVSREHGRIHRTHTSSNGSTQASKESFVVEDRSSYNGVFVNGLRVAHKQELQHGDLIQIGDYHLILQDEEVKDTAPAVATNADITATMPTAGGFRGQTLTERPSRIVVLAGPKPGVEFPLDRERLTIGRAEDATISIQHNSVSRLHCEVHALGDGRFEIVDNGSANGVRVNTVLLHRAIIEAGDIIEIGDVRLKFVGAGQVFVHGPTESQQLRIIRDRETPVLPQKRARHGYALAGAGIAVVIVVGALMSVHLARSKKPHSPTTAPTTTPGPEYSLLIEAKRACSVDDCELPHSQITTQIAPTSPLRQSPDYQQIEATWADSILKKAQAESDPSARRALLDRVANAETVDSARRKIASDQIATTNTMSAMNAMSDGATPSSQQPSVVATANLANPARQPTQSTKRATTPTPIDAAVPPRRTPADGATPVPTPNASVAPKASNDALEKARLAALDGRPGEVRALLEARVHGGHASSEEVRLVRGACKELGDMACLDDIKKKY
ncbi:MAG: FHA domain-containing protein [Polyangiaceae bacterium]|nr:FHA domain-containing protein [Polyangiaceae bacterium]